MKMGIPDRALLATIAIAASTAGLPLNAQAAADNQSTVEINYVYADSPNGKFGEYSGLNDEHSNLVVLMDAMRWITTCK